MLFRSAIRKPVVGKVVPVVLDCDAREQYVGRVDGERRRAWRSPAVAVIGLGGLGDGVGPARQGLYPEPDDPGWQQRPDPGHAVRSPHPRRDHPAATLAQQHGALIGNVRLPVGGSANATRSLRSDRGRRSAGSSRELLWRRLRRQPARVDLPAAVQRRFETRISR